MSLMTPCQFIARWQNTVSFLESMNCFRPTRHRNAWTQSPLAYPGGAHMELGVALPTSARYASAESIVRIAREAELLGYSSLWTYERLLYPIAGITRPDGSTQQLPEPYQSVYEPIETLGYVAACTQRVGKLLSHPRLPDQSQTGAARRHPDPHGLQHPDSPQARRSPGRYPQSHRLLI